MFTYGANMPEQWHGMRIIRLAVLNIRQNLQMVNNKWCDITREDLLAIAKNVNIRKANEIIEQVKGGVAKWNRLATEYGVPQDMIKTIDSTLLLDI